MKIKSLALLASTLYASTMHAQTNAGAFKYLPAQLTPAERETLSRLDSLTRLPDGWWRWHVSDMPHGESPTLDLTKWSVADPNPDLAYPSTALWFRQWIQVPRRLHGYDLTGARIWFRFRAGADGILSEIVYLNGQRVAMGEKLEPIVLFDSARVGDSVLVAVKLLPTEGPKYFAGGEMHVDFAANRPNPGQFLQEYLGAAEILPTMSKDSATTNAALVKAIGQVDSVALLKGDQVRFDASLRQAESTLAAVRPMLRTLTEHETGNSHIDAAWLWPWTETVDVVHRTFSTALQLMSEYPDYTFTQSAAAYNEWIAEKYPAMDEEIKQRIKEGRWEIVGGMWVEPDLNMPDGESTVRSILIGKRWFQQHYGVDVHVGWNPDSFGYDWQLPQIYKRSGIDYFATQKLGINDTQRLPFKLFWWAAPDGSKVLAYFPHEYGNRTLEPVRLGADFRQARIDAPGLTEMMDLYGVGDHGGGPTRVMLDEGHAWMDSNRVAPRMEFGTAQSYFNSVEKEVAPNSPVWDYRSIAKGYTPPPEPAAGQVAIPTWRDEMYLEFHRGVYTTQANHKRNMRESSEWALNAEKYASLAWLAGDPYPGDALTEAWKKITFNQFHDLAAGSGIADIYRDAERDYDQVRLATREVTTKALSTLAAHVNTAASHVAGSVPVLVFNSLAWERSGVVPVDVQLPAAAFRAAVSASAPVSTVSVLDASGQLLPSEVMGRDARTGTFHLLVDVRNVPSLGYTTLQVVPGHRAYATDIHVHGTTIENSRLRIVIDSVTGCITSLYDKTAHFESLAAGSCGNALQAFADLPKEFDAWNIDPGTLDKAPTVLTHADSVRVVEVTPLRAVVRVTRHWQHSVFVQDIVLYSGMDEAVVANDIDWHETHVLLKAAFPLAATSAFATYEIPFGTIQRPTTRNNSWEQARFEVPALQWADLGDTAHGFSLINDSKYGYDGRDNVLRLSLLRSPTWPDSTADRGSHHFSYALYPHSGGWKQALTVRHGYEFNYPLTAEQVASHAGDWPAVHSFISVMGDHVVLTAVKKAEDSSALIFRLYEWAGDSGQVQLHVPPGATAASAVNLMETSMGALTLHDGVVTVPVHPYEIVTVRVDYPVVGN